MTRILTIIALLIAPSATVAANDGVSTQEFCATWGTLASAIMTVRQRGVPMSKVMEMETTRFERDGVDFKISNVVILAYEQPQWASEKLRAEAVSEFRNEMELLCYKAALK